MAYTEMKNNEVKLFFEQAKAEGLSEELIEETKRTLNLMNEDDKAFCEACLLKDWKYSFRFILDMAEDFEEFYILVNELKTRCLEFEHYEDILWDLYEVVQEYEEIYSCTYNLKKDLATYIIYLTFGTKGKNEFTEKQYQKKIIEQFANIPQFKNFTFIKDEFVCDDGRIDILAKDNVTGKNVIIELKKANKSPNRQLISYNYFMGGDNILIGVTEQPVKIKCSNIIYYTYDELQVNMTEKQNKKTKPRNFQ